MGILLDVHAPLRTFKVTPWKPQIWFNVEIKRMKCHVRKQERLCRSHPGDHTWNVYKESKWTYFNLIKSEKRKILSGAIQEAKGDSKKLFNLVKSLTGTNPDNPMPPGSDQDLADSFSQFFMTKIQKIRTQLENFPQFIPEIHQGIPAMENFIAVTAQEVRKAILSLHPKSCELDPIPVKLFREIFEYILDFLTFLFNKSLETGCFMTDWKCAVL